MTEVAEPRFAISTAPARFLSGFAWSVGGKKGSRLRFHFSDHSKALHWVQEDADYTLLHFRKLTEMVDHWKVVPK